MSGAIYTRWGRTTCSDTLGTELVYEGLAGGSDFNQYGGGANYLFLPNDPEYLKDGQPRYYSSLYGAEYQNPISPSALPDHNVPCAVCYTSRRTSKLMIPAKITCPSSWTQEYIGYLMTTHHTYRVEFMNVLTRMLKLYLVVWLARMGIILSCCCYMFRYTLSPICVNKDNYMYLYRVIIVHVQMYIYKILYMSRVNTNTFCCFITNTCTTLILFTFCIFQ